MYYNQTNSTNNSTIQYNTIQYNTIQYNTIQYNTIQYNTIQYNTIHTISLVEIISSGFATYRNGRYGSLIVCQITLVVIHNTWVRARDYTCTHYTLVHSRQTCMYYNQTNSTNNRNIHYRTLCRYLVSNYTAT